MYGPKCKEYVLPAHTDSKELAYRGDRGSLGQKIHFTAYFYYELAI